MRPTDCSNAQALPARPTDVTSARVVVVGLGYVGLPLAVALAGKFACTGLDIDTRRID